MNPALLLPPPLGIADTITVLRQRSPEALICIACGRLLASRRESYASSALSDAVRLAYVCAECRQEAAEAQRAHAVRLEVAQRAAEASAEARRQRARGRPQDDVQRGQGARQGQREGAPVVQHSPEAHRLTGPAVYAGIRGAVIETPRGGRPRTHATDRERRTAAQRAWRARQTAKATAQVNEA